MHGRLLRPRLPSLRCAQSGWSGQPLSVFQLDSTRSARPYSDDRTPAVSAPQHVPCSVVLVRQSPWIDKGTVVHEPPAPQRPSPDSEYEHSSVIATLRKVLNLGGAPLTARERWLRRSRTCCLIETRHAWTVHRHYRHCHPSTRLRLRVRCPSRPTISNASSCVKSVLSVRAGCRALTTRIWCTAQANTCNPPGADERHPSEFATQLEAGQHIRLRFQRMLDAAMSL